MIEIIKEKGGEVNIKGKLTVHHIEDAFKRFSACIEEDSRQLTLNLNEVAELDTAGAQVLLAFIRSYGTARVSLDSCPEEILVFLERSGLTEHLR